MVGNKEPQFGRLGEEPNKVVVLRALQLGDLLCAVPAFRALRAALPRAHITLAGLPWAREFVERFAQYFDGFLEFPGYPGLPERPVDVRRIPSFLAAAQEKRFDLALQMHGSGVVTNPIALLFGARRTAGYYPPGGPCPDPGGFLAYPAELPEVWRHLRLLEFLGIPPRGEELEFPAQPDDGAALRAIAGAAELGERAYVCLHPGARAAARRWPAEHFAAVADALADRGLGIVLTGSTDETALTDAVARVMRAPVLDLAGRTNLGALAALLRGARLLICNDTGVSHLAAAVRTPSVVVFHQLSEREGWPPLDRQRHRVVARARGVLPADVLAQAAELLAPARADAATQATARGGTNAQGKNKRSCEPPARGGT
jgi:ADP-heptose:LPS heptosyltransferase